MCEVCPRSLLAGERWKLLDYVLERHTLVFMHETATGVLTREPEAAVILVVRRLTT